MIGSYTERLTVPHSRRLTRKLNTELAKLDAQESNLISLAAALADDGPERARARTLAELHQIDVHRSRLRAERDTITDDLTTGTGYLDDRLRLFENLRERDRHANDDQRREPNQTTLRQPLRHRHSEQHGPQEEGAAHASGSLRTSPNLDKTKVRGSNKV
ncbi:MAG TPA: hypothetical protein VIS06_08620 [Mycobacteriales bacterium]